MPDCELLSTCPFFSDSTYGMPDTLKEQFCKGEFRWCGRYMAFKALEREKKIVKSAVTLGSLSKSKGDE